ncbi:hypothetical protein, partial [uncultured Rikenella sp.]|uniref:hypothetical protein n=1 Tax=uncultured Rikenella sp. TaxID=368003 RepID=UPI0026124DAF
VTPAGRSDTAYRLISSAQFFIRAPARFIYIRLPPKELNRFFGVARGYFEVIKAARRGANASAGRAVR